MRCGGSLCVVTLTLIERYLEEFGAHYLSPQESLRIEILDIALACRPRILGSATAVTRVCTGQSDWPRIELRYALTSTTTALKADGRDCRRYDLPAAPPGKISVGFATVREENARLVVQGALCLARAALRDSVTFASTGTLATEITAQTGVEKHWDT